MNRYTVQITKGSEKMDTFTWAKTIEGARERMAEQMAEQGEIWEGWTATVSE